MKKIILACLLIPFMFSNVNAEEKIGQVNKVQTYAHGTRVYQEREPLFARDEIYRNEIVETVKSGALWIIFNDDTELFMGESARVTIDKFVYHGVNDIDSMVINLTKGVFRFISGSIQSEKIIINSPVATIGIRGTDVEIMIDDTGAMIVTAFEGSVSVRSSSVRSSGPIDMAAYTEGCQSILIANDGTILGVEPCPRGGPSIGPASFASGHSGGGGGHQNSPSSPGGDSGGPSGGDSGGPSGGDSGGPGDGPSGGPGNGNGNNGNSGNGGGNTNGSGPGTGNNGSNNGQGNGAGNGGGGNGNGGNR